MIDVLLADDHETVREGLRLLIDAQPDMRVVAEVGNGQSAIERVTALKPAVLILDLSMPDMTGLAAARSLKDAHGTTAIVVLTRHDDSAYVQELFAAGASAYVLKQSASAELVRAVRVAAAGGHYVDRVLTSSNTPHDTTRRPHTPRATDREAEVLRMIAVGHSNKDIAATLNISIKTVEVHKANAMRKLGLKGRTDVIRYAILKGWLSGE